MKLRFFEKTEYSKISLILLVFSVCSCAAPISGKYFNKWFVQSNMPSIQNYVILYGSPTSKATVNLEGLETDMYIWRSYEGYGNYQFVVVYTDKTGMVIVTLKNFVTNGIAPLLPHQVPKVFTYD